MTARTYRERVRELAHQMGKFLEASGEYVPLDPRFGAAGNPFYGSVSLHIVGGLWSPEERRKLFPKPRDVAFCEMRGKLTDPEFHITVHPKIVPGYDRMAKLGHPVRDRFEGVIRHELAHCALIWEDAALNAIGEETDPHTERQTDGLAELVFGDKIRYDADDIETIGPGTWPRPARLPK